MKTIDCNCLIGQYYYKICPKCNDRHNGTCQNCAWQGCMGPCDVNPRVFPDGSHTSHPLQPVKRKLSARDFVQVNSLWNVFYFDNEYDANLAISQIKDIFAEEDKDKRVMRYLEWKYSRLTKFEKQVEFIPDTM